MSDAQSGGVKKPVTLFHTERTFRPTRCKNVGGGRDHTGMRSSSSSESESESNTEVASSLERGSWTLGKKGVLGKE